MRNRLRIALVLLCIGVLSAGIVVRQRMAFDQSNRQVELVVGYRDMTKLASLSGVPASEMLEWLRAESRVQSIAIEEDTVGDWIDSGRLTAWQFPHNRFELVANQPDDYRRLLAVLSAELGQRVSSNSQTLTISLQADYENLMEIGLGFDLDVVGLIRSHGFALVPRLRQSVRPTPALVDLKLRWAQDIAPGRPIIFDGVVALGHPFRMNQVAHLLDQSQSPFGVIEFTDQLGVPQLSRQVPGLALKVHSLSDAEIENLSTDTVVNRYVRAVRERNVKLLFLKPFYYLPEDALAEGMIPANLAYFDRVANRVQTVATITPIEGHNRSVFPPISKWVEVGLMMGVLGGLLWVTQTLSNRTSVMVLGGLGYAGLIGIARIDPILGRQLAALAVAIMAPVWAIQYLIHFDAKSGKLGAMLRAILTAVTGCSVGIVLIIGLLSDQAFLVGGRQFLGVKLAFLVPLLVPAWHWITASRGATRSGILRAVRDLLFAPVLTISLLALIGGSAAITLYLIRSGNASVLPPTGVERVAREWLEGILSVRPRTKEILIGYPALVAALLMPKSGRFSAIRWPLFLIGTLAFISVINSFCHGHTPILISAVRGALGLVIGVSVGVIGYLGLKGLKWVIWKM